jgi:cytochrome b561
MALKSGWLAAALIVIAAAIPLLYRARNSKRATPESKAIRTHVVLGLLTSLAAFLHTGLVLPELGSEAAVGGGSVAFLVGALAFLVMVAHGGLGLGLRNPKIRDRAQRRRRHATTAVLLVLLVAVHVVVLRRGAR